MGDQNEEKAEEARRIEEEVADLRGLLSTEGVDLLGRWLKSKEDKKATLKAERDYVTREIEANDKSIEFIKARISDVMRATGTEKVKGHMGYSFTSFTKVTTEVNKDVLKEKFQELVESVLRDNEIIPDDVTISLGASVKGLAEDVTELPEWYTRTMTPSVRFTKPRSKE